MPTAGPGAAIADLLGGGNPNRQISQMLAGQPQQQPPGAPPQQNGAPAQPPPQAPSQAPAQATQPNPGSAQVMEALLNVHQRAQAVEGFNQAVEGFASRFGTAQQQASKVAQLGRGQADDPLAAIHQAQDIQGTATTQAEHAALMQDPEAIGRMLNLQPGVATAAARAGVLGQMLTAWQSQQAPTEQQKNAEAETKQWIQANPQATPQEIAAHHAAVLAGQIPGPGQTTLNKQATDSTAFKDLGVQDFRGVHVKLDEGEGLVNQLLADMPNTMKALSTPDLFTTSDPAAWAAAFGVGVDPAIKSQAVAIKKLKDELTGAGLTEVKNLRNKTEFNTIGEALTGGLNANIGEKGVRKALEAIQTKMTSAHAQAYATAGKQIPQQYIGLADDAYMKKTLPNGMQNPYYTGASYENDFSKMGEGEADAAIHALSPGAKFIGPDGQPHTRN